MPPVANNINKMRKRKKFSRIFAILTISVILFFHFYVPRFITEIKNPIIEIIKGNYLKANGAEFENNQLNGKSINFKSFDNVELSSYLTYSSLDTVKGTIILLHGIRSNKGKRTAKYIL